MPKAITATARIMYIANSKVVRLLCFFLIVKSLKYINELKIILLKNSPAIFLQRLPNKSPLANTIIWPFPQDGALSLFLITARLTNCNYIYNPLNTYAVMININLKQIIYWEFFYFILIFGT